MRTSICLLLFSLFPTVGCRTFCTHADRPTSISPAEAASIGTSVKAFASNVEHGITERGPAAWRTYLAEGPEFFMVADGRLVFSNGAAAVQGIKDLEQSITHIELRWGDSLQVDPLTPTLAMFAAPYHEVLIYSSGQRVDATGYFTALAERGPAGWRFRNAHWSSATSR
jgi:hypothetical protein